MSVTSGAKRKEGGIAETGRVIFHALIIALVIRTFLFQPFNIPSGSMKATLLVGDYLFVSKYSYGYSHYSLPFSPPLLSPLAPVSSGVGLVSEVSAFRDTGSPIWVGFSLARSLRDFLLSCDGAVSILVLWRDDAMNWCVY